MGREEEGGREERGMERNKNPPSDRSALGYGPEQHYFNITVSAVRPSVFTDIQSQ